MANIMNMVKLKNKTSRNGFDLSHKNLFTAKVGELLPVACIECIPGDSFDIDMAWFTRTQPVNTAAYTRIREYYDWYFVPTNLMWNKFNTFVTQMTDNNQKATGINSNTVLSDEHPYFTEYQIGNYMFQNNSAKNYFGFSRALCSCKLLSYLNYGYFDDWLAGPPNNGHTNVKLNPFPLLAYQKIYQDFFRDSQWEKAYAPAYNLDYITGAAGSLNIPVSSIDYDQENMFDLRYCNWNKDYFMGLLPSSQYGDIAIVSDKSFEPLYVKTSDSSRLTVGDNVQIGAFQDSTDTATLNTSSNSNYLTLWDKTKFTILALRQAEAKQKWAEITQSNQQDYKSQIEAHFGVSVSDAYSDRCKYVGGVAGNVDIAPVTNTNLTGANEAEIAGRGEGGARGSINFDTKVHGYLMCIYHAVPLLDYAITGVQRQNLKTSVYDYAIPEFDATGMVSVPMIELTKYFNSDYQVEDILLGYAPRYIDYKTRYDLVHGGFTNQEGLENWVAPITNDYIKEYVDNLGTSISSGFINYHWMKVPPSIVDRVFGVDAGNTPGTDQFLINCSFDIKAVRNLDRNGLPY